VDGESHNNEWAYIRDKKRQNILENMGLEFLRFDDLDVKRNLPWVLSKIEEFILEFEK